MPALELLRMSGLPGTLGMFGVLRMLEMLKVAAADAGRARDVEGISFEWRADSQL